MVKSIEGEEHRSEKIISQRTGMFAERLCFLDRTGKLHS